nr:hypothetical protein [Tanacetum cinerariifolium]
MILYGADNRPPMLDKDLYDSWKSRMELYMQNREHERMILESVENGPLIWPTIEEERENVSCMMHLISLRALKGKHLSLRALKGKHFTHIVTPLDGDWTEYVSGGVTLLRISSTKHKERPLR